MRNYFIIIAISVLLIFSSIAANADIVNSANDTLEFDTAQGKDPGFIRISGDIYAIVYAGDGDDGFVQL